MAARGRRLAGVVPVRFWDRQGLNCDTDVSAPAAETLRRAAGGEKRSRVGLRSRVRMGTEDGEEDHSTHWAFRRDEPAQTRIRTQFTLPRRCVARFEELAMFGQNPSLAAHRVRRADKKG